MHLYKHLNVWMKDGILICKRSIQALRREGREMDAERTSFHRDHSLHKKDNKLKNVRKYMRKVHTLQVNA